MMDWRPTASIETLRLRARLLKTLRAFFDERDIMEVETPILSQAAATDPNIESFSVKLAHDADGYLHTSPEFAMKRLLAAEVGSIYQLCKVFRQGEAGRKHNPEFTLLEWYRPGLDHHALMEEVEQLIYQLLDSYVSLQQTVRLTYRNAYIQFANMDPFTATVQDLSAAATKQGLSDIVGLDEVERDTWLDLLMTHVIEPRLPRNRPVFIYDYPASQAALARIRDEEYPVAERFELYINGLELANGFHELTDAAEQRERFAHDRGVRDSRNMNQPPMDAHFLAALAHGMPACAGVALGVDRLLMLASGAQEIAQVMAFDLHRA